MESLEDYFIIRSYEETNDILEKIHDIPLDRSFPYEVSKILVEGFGTQSYKARLLSMMRTEQSQDIIDKEIDEFLLRMFIFIEDCKVWENVEYPYNLRLAVKYGIMRLADNMGIRRATK